MVDNRSTTKARNRKDRRLVRAGIIQAYKQRRSCEVCGESRVVCLDFHHRVKEHKKFDISAGVHDDLSIERLRDEMEKCMIVCSNCHRVLHIDDNGDNAPRVSDDVYPLFDSPLTE